MKNMTNAEINDRINELSKILDTCNPVSEEWDKAYNEYMDLRAIQDEMYRQENQVSFNKFYEKHIKGKTWNEINPEIWQTYSDWHKDMYGYRPKSI